jgi:hypothetical protein
MSLFVIGDLHLALGDKSKSMDIFDGWENYTELLGQSWNSLVSAEDTIVLAGDISWAISLEKGYEDFKWIHNLPGRKIILKGNHDYWWNSRKKMEETFEKWGFDSLNILHNNHFQYENYGICGTRGWVNMPGESADAKVLAREAGRLTASIESALTAGLQPLVFLHYPPLYGSSYNYDILDVLYKYGIKNCWYGHLHGPSIKYAVNGERDGVDFRLISGDFLQFRPEKIL